MAAQTVSGTCDKHHRKVLVVGKVPPVQGGTAASTLWASVELAKAGYNVHVITNARSVEPNFRVLLLSEDLEYLDNLARTLPLSFHYTEDFPHRSLVPWAPAYFSSLLGTTLDLVSKIDPDFIVGWYMEPYGLVAAIAAELSGKPAVFRHAGSDLGRLISSSPAEKAYKWALKKFSVVATSPRHFETFVQLGVPRPKLYPYHAPALSPPHRMRQTEWPQEGYLQGAAEWLSANEIRLRPASDDRSASAQFRIAVCGKVGRHKCSIQLLDALGVLAAENLDFELALAVCGTPLRLRAFFSKLNENQDLRARSKVFPPLPPWRMPAFFGGSSLVACLEHQFPIQEHTSVLPREVLASGACLVASRELLEKSVYRSSFVPRKNCVVIDDPDDQGMLVSILRALMGDPSGTHLIGVHGGYLSRFMEDDRPAIHPMVTLLDSLAARGRRGSS